MTCYKVPPATMSHWNYASNSKSGGTHLSYNTLLYFLLCTELSSLFSAFSDHFQDQWWPNPDLLKSSELKEKSRWGSIWQGEISPDFQWPWCLQSSLRRYFIALLTPKLSMAVPYNWGLSSQTDPKEALTWPHQQFLLWGRSGTPSENSWSKQSPRSVMVTLLASCQW